jgi:DNA polymerase I-like protein with 3'-5' exonuclease and polymerase domains
MPYKCIERDGKYYLEEAQNVLWHEVDIHGATTEKATGLTPDDPNFSKLRSIIGKRVNFAKNYGAQLNKIREMFPDKSLEECRQIDGAYYAAFPGVKEYHRYCETIAYQQAAVINLFGVYYWNVSGHKLKNLLIQGSAAYFLKLKIIEIDKYLQTKHSKIQMQIHDELSFEWDPRDGFEIFAEIKALMEVWDDCKIPIVADMEITTTNWKEKHEV